MGVLARFIQHPLDHHWLAAKRVLRYLKGTAHLGLIYRGNDPKAAVRDRNSVLLGPVFTDANWAGDVDDRKSTSGMVSKINGCAVNWKSKKQTVVALSTAESELIAATEALKEALWLRHLCDELGFKQLSPTVVYGDNESSIAIRKNGATSSSTKHIDLREHCLRDYAAKGEIDLKWISTSEQQADIFTKALSKHPFCGLRDEVMGITTR